jgi:hypothetical protein
MDQEYYSQAVRHQPEVSRMRRLVDLDNTSLSDSPELITSGLAGMLVQGGLSKENHIVGLVGTTSLGNEVRIMTKVGLAPWTSNKLETIPLGVLKDGERNRYL